MTPQTRIEPVDPNEDEVYQMSLESVRRAKENGNLWAVPLLQHLADERLKELETATRTITQLFPRGA